MVGLSEGFADGAFEGASDGTTVGVAEGSDVAGIAVGVELGPWLAGERDGSRVGIQVGYALGILVGWEVVGVDVGAPVSGHFWQRTGQFSKMLGWNDSFRQWKLLSAEQYGGSDTPWHLIRIGGKHTSSKSGQHSGPLLSVFQVKQSVLQMHLRPVPNGLSSKVEVVLQNLHKEWNENQSAQKPATIIWHATSNSWRWAINF